MSDLPDMRLLPKGEDAEKPTFPYWCAWYTIYDEEEAPFQYWATGRTMGENRNGNTIFEFVGLIRAINVRMAESLLMSIFPKLYVRFVHPVLEDFVPSTNFEPPP